MVAVQHDEGGGGGGIGGILSDFIDNHPAISNFLQGNWFGGGGDNRGGNNNNNNSNRKNNVNWNRAIRQFTRIVRPVTRIFR